MPRLECWTCGAPLERKPGPGRNPRFCDDRCRYRYSHPAKTAAERSAAMRLAQRAVPVEVRSARSHAAAEARWRDHVKVPPKPKPSRKVERTCRFCGAVVPMAAHQRSCGSPDCRLARHAERMREGGWSKARRAAERSAPVVEQFCPADVYERDGWTCGICGEPVGRDLGWPDPLSVSLDHIVPLSLGGEHTWANVRCSHLRCNTARGNRVA